MDEAGPFAPVQGEDPSAGPRLSKGPPKPVWLRGEATPGDSSPEDRRSSRPAMDSPSRSPGWQRVSDRENNRRLTKEKKKKGKEKKKKKKKKNREDSSDDERLERRHKRKKSRH